MKATWAVGIGASLIGSSAFGAFVAYNDFVTGYGANANVTQYGIANTGAQVLKDVNTGANVAPTMTITNVNAISGGSGPATEIAAGTDAANVFGGKVATAGSVIYYGTAGNWYVDLAFAGLDPAQKYTFAGVLDRGSSAYANKRWSAISIAGADASVYAASAGAYKVNDAKVSIDSFNTTLGYIARWTDIQPGADGAFTVRFTYATSSEMPAEYVAGASAGYGYGPAGIMLEEQAAAVPEPASLGLLALGALSVLRRRK